MDNIREFYGALYGEEVTREQIHDQGWECLEDEWAFNKKAGITPESAYLSDALQKDPIAGQVFDVPMGHHQPDVHEAAGAGRSLGGAGERLVRPVVARWSGFGRPRLPTE